MARRTRKPRAVENITHEYAKRRNLPSAEHEPLMRDEERNSIRVAYERPNSMHRSTFLPLQHAATLIFSVDWGLCSGHVGRLPQGSV